MDVNKNDYAFHVGEYGEIQPLNLLPDAGVGEGVPKSLLQLKSVDIGSSVTAVAISNLTYYVFTGSSNGIKMWDLNKPTRKTPVDQFHFMPPKCHVLTMKLLPFGPKIIAGGETSSLSVFDLGSPTIRKLAVLPFMAQSCYSMATSSDQLTCYSCDSDGFISVWDLRTNDLVRQFSGHTGGANCVDIFSNGIQLLTGGMDKNIRVWDLRACGELKNHEYSTIVNSVACSPVQGIFLVGLNNGFVEIVHVNHPGRCLLTLHKGHMTSLMFAPLGNWFIGTSTDALLNMSRMPHGAKIYQTMETAPVWCVDISADETGIVTGSQDRATMYAVI